MSKISRDFEDGFKSMARCMIQCAVYELITGRKVSSEQIEQMVHFLRRGIKAKLKVDEPK